MKNMYLWIGTFTLIAIVGGFFMLPGNETTTNNNIDVNIEELTETVTIHFFWGDGCPLCHTQIPYLEQWAEKYPGVELKMYETWKDKDNQVLFQQMASAYGTQVRGVPATFIGEKNWVGFSPAMAGEIENYIVSCLKYGCDSPVN